MYACKQRDRINEDLRVSCKLIGSPNRKGANSKLKNLKPLGGILGLQVCGFSGVEGQNSMPWGRVRTSVLQRNRHKIWFRYVVLNFVEWIYEIRLGDLFYRPLRTADGGGFLVEEREVRCLGAKEAPPHHWKWWHQRSAVVFVFKGTFETDILICRYLELKKTKKNLNHFFSLFRVAKTLKPFLLSSFQPFRVATTHEKQNSKQILFRLIQNCKLPTEIHKNGDY